MSTIDAYLKNNASYAGVFAKGDLPVPPAGKIAVVACMDARLETGVMLGIAEGDAHVIRNAGGLVTDDVIRSLAISQHFLGAREIMLIQHTDCGMQGSSEDELRQAIERAAGEAPHFELGAFEDLERNLRESIARIEASPFVLHKDAVRGFVFEVETGRLREVA